MLQRILVATFFSHTGLLPLVFSLLVYWYYRHIYIIPRGGYPVTCKTAQGSNTFSSVARCVVFTISLTSEELMGPELRK